MATFVHLTARHNLKSIKRNGIKGKTRLSYQGKVVPGVFVSPVTPNYYASHQWLRELKRWQRERGPMVAIYLRIPDEELVLVGRYNEKHIQMTAAEAIAMMMQREDIGGNEVIVPRNILRGEIFRVKFVQQVIGWRYYPESHGKKPCGCPYCQRGKYGARKLRDRYEKELS